MDECLGMPCPGPLVRQHSNHPQNLPFNYRMAAELSPEALAELRETFDKFDKNKNVREERNLL